MLMSVANTFVSQNGYQSSLWKNPITTASDSLLMVYLLIKTTNSRSKLRSTEFCTFFFPWMTCHLRNSKQLIGSMFSNKFQPKQTNY